MSTLLLVRLVGDDSTDVVSRTAESLGFGESRIVLITLVGLATVAGLHFASRAIGALAGVIKSIIVAGLGLLLIAAAMGLVFLLAMTAI